jgi:hypothetical protein
MKKITLLSLLMLSSLGFAQTKSTGLKTFVTGLTASLTLDNSTSTIGLTLSGPSDRWIAFKLGSFTTAMSAGVDGVYYNGTTLVDGNGGQLTTDATQNWIVSSNTVNAGVRTIVATRAFNTGDASDYTVNYANTTIDIAAAYGPTADSYTLEYHGVNKNKFVDTTFTTLGVEDFSLNASSVYPNPSNGTFTISSKTNLTEINVYSQTGALVKTIKVEDSSEKAEVVINGLQSGVYLIELKNDSDKSWKKVIVN